MKQKNTSPLTPMYNLLKPVKSPSEEEISKIPSYLMIKWLSNNPITVIPANLININYNIPIFNQYQFLDDYFTLTKIKNKRLFIRSSKQTQATQATQAIIENIKTYYNVNDEIAREYYTLMSKEKIKEFKNMYTEGKV